MTNYTIKILLIIVIALTISSCDKTINSVNNGQTVGSGRRDYEWTVDTLKLGWDVFYGRQMWGSSASDVWLVGSSDASWNAIWHYNGVRWEKDSMSRNVDPTAIWGFSQNDVWLGNSDGTFWHYDGNKWTKFSEHRIPDYDRLITQGIWGNAANDVWAVGFADTYNGQKPYRGTLMHFDGIYWTFVQVPDLRVSFVRIRKQKTSSLLFLGAWSTNNAVGDIYKLYAFDGTNMREVFSGSSWGNLEDVNGEIYYVKQGVVYKYRDNELYVWKDFGQTTNIGLMIGRNEKDFFGEQKGGGILHYNGTDLKLVYPITAEVCGACIFQRDVFFECEDLSIGLHVIIHGKLKE